MKGQKRYNQGMSLYLTMMILSLILGLAFAVNTLLMIRTKSLRDIGNSVVAFTATETGIERALYGMEKEAEIGPWTETLSNGASYSAKFLNPGEGSCPIVTLSYCIESIGAYKDVKRGIRIVR